jgi:rfaE bifunctional protein nucleotidyltransferase chain/domain
MARLKRGGATGGTPVGEVIRDYAVLADILNQHRKHNERIVSTNGVFDVLHVGHVRYLQQARKLGDRLVVAINSDASTTRLKGPQRPFVCEAERAELLAALACVDYVTIFDESTPEAILEIIKPDIHTKGGDYDVEAMPETRVVRAHGGKVQTLPFTAGRSTTELTARILDTSSAPADDTRR